jgi:NADH-ubiquinone oxidoreductase chain 5
MIKKLVGEYLQRLNVGTSDRTREEIVQNDMVMAVGLSQYTLSVFHLVNHAYFKALLFLSAGAVIHALGDEQDMRKYGGLINIIPFTYVSILIGSLSLLAIPYLTGFYSKDLILEVAYGQYKLNGIVAY